jgi:hypothetical protein
MRNIDQARLEMKRLIREEGCGKGIKFESVGLRFGFAKRHHEIRAVRSGGTDEEFDLSGLFVHHEKMSLARVRWHLERHDELLSNKRPMLLSSEGGNNYVVDGCHRTVALVLLGVDRFTYASWVL